MAAGSHTWLGGVAETTVPGIAKNYRHGPGDKSNSPVGGGLARRLGGASGQTTVEYMLLVAIVVVAMAGGLQVLFEALAVLFKVLGELISSPYP